MNVMSYEHLLPVAEYHFKKMRSTARFLHIFEVKRKGELYFFYACFQGKKRRLLKKIILDEKGRLIKKM